MRNIFIVNATQVVTSEAHPEGVHSVYQGYPKNFDSIDYNDNVELARIVADAEYSDRVKQFAISSASNRVKWTVTLSNTDGDVLTKRTYGAFPVLTPTPEPEPEEAEEPIAD